MTQNSLMEIQRGYMRQEMIADIQDLQRKFGPVTVIKGINAQVRVGEVIALLGKNGSGKTTLLETILGFAHPSFGAVNLWGKRATEIIGEQKQKIGYVPQQDELLVSMTGVEHLTLFRSFRKTWNQSLVEKLILEWMIPMEIKVGKLSPGQRQKLSILLAIAHEPQLLVLDEPVASLDPIARRQFLQQIIEIASDSQRTVIFSTHIVSDVERVANQVWLMRDGVLDFQGELDALKESVIRLTLKNTSEIASFVKTIPGLLRVIENPQFIKVTLKEWTYETEIKVKEFTKGSIELEYLGLEDIFLEMNL
jgi:ABC-2 type transport system ATP-binding protein